MDDGPKDPKPGALPRGASPADLDHLRAVVKVAPRPTSTPSRLPRATLPPPPAHAPHHQPLAAAELAKIIEEGRALLDADAKAAHQVFEVRQRGGDALILFDSTGHSCSPAAPVAVRRHGRLRSFSRSIRFQGRSDRFRIDAAILAHNCSDDLVAEHERQLRVRKLAVEDVEVGSADPTGLHLDEQLPRPWGGFRHLRLP